MSLDILPKKTAIIDASSAIILAKASLHNDLVELYDIVMPESVYLEISINPYPGSTEYKDLLGRGKIKIEKQGKEMANQAAFEQLGRLGQGEADTIKMYFAGLGDFIIVDDGAAVKYCLNKKIPFINALLLPVVMEIAGTVKSSVAKDYFNNIKKIGRYSKQVILRAEGLTAKEIGPFIF